MGAWAVGNFENDDALDWVSDIVESSGIEKADSTAKCITQPA